MPEKSEATEWGKKIQEEAASTVFQLLSKWVEKGVDWLKEKVEWELAAANYVHRWIDRWGQIQPLGADHPIPLHRIYVHVRAVPRSVLQRFVNIEQMQAAVPQGRRRNPFGLSEQELRDYTPRPGMKIANEHARLNLLGAPGAGKSTFLRRLGLEALMPRTTSGEIEWRYKSEYEHASIPVLLELRSLRASPCAEPSDIVALIVAEFVTAGFPKSLQFVEGALEKGFLLVLLDGVDEIPTAQLDTAVGAIRNFISRYPKCRYVLSCRTAFYRDWFTGFHDFVLADFDDDEIAAFAHNWFTRPDEIAQKAASNFFDLLSTEDHRATRELAGSPILLTFLCLVFRKTQQFPPNRAQLYQKALRIYLEEWNASKLVHNERIYQELSPEMELELLKEIAGPAFIDNRYFFTGAELKSVIKRFLENELNAPKSLSPGQILETIAIQQGLFVERAQDIWTFSHLTIQEYLAAAWMLEEGQADEIIRLHATDDRWREIFLLMSGLTRVDVVLDMMMECAHIPLSISAAIQDLWVMLDVRAKKTWKRIMGEPRFDFFRIAGPIVGQAYLRARDLVLVLDRVRARDRDHERDVSQAREFDQNLDGVFDRAIVKALDANLDTNLSRAASLTNALDRDLDVALERPFVGDLGVILSAASDRALDRVRERIRVQTLAITTEYDHELAPQRQRERETEKESLQRYENEYAQQQIRRSQQEAQFQVKLKREGDKGKERLDLLQRKIKQLNRSDPMLAAELMGELMQETKLLEKHLQELEQERQTERKREEKTALEIEKKGKEEEERQRELRRERERPREMEKERRLSGVSNLVDALALDFCHAITRALDRNHARNWDVEIPRDLDRAQYLARSLAQELAGEIALNLASDAKVDLALIADLDLARETAMGPDLNIARDVASTRHLSRHVRICGLVGMCRRAGLRVSREAWQNACARMLCSFTYGDGSDER